MSFFSKHCTQPPNWVWNLLRILARERRWNSLFD